MKVHETEKRTKEYDHVLKSYELCDKCGVKILTDCYDAYEFELKIKTGSTYPEGGSGEEKTVHLCQKCSEFLIDVMKQSGIRVNTEEWDF